MLINLAKTPSPVSLPFHQNDHLALCTTEGQRSCLSNASPRPQPQSPCCPLSATGRVRGPLLLTSTLEEVAVDVLYGSIDGGARGDTSRSDVRVILRIYILKSFPWNSRMEFWEITNKMKIKT